MLIIAYPEVHVFHGNHCSLDKHEPSTSWTITYVSRKWRAISVESKRLWAHLQIRGYPGARSTKVVELGMILPTSFYGDLRQAHLPTSQRK